MMVNIDTEVNMPSIKENAMWVADIYKLTTDAPVLAFNEEDNSDGPANVQAEQLANRTSYLKQAVEGIQVGESPYSSVANVQDDINAGVIPLNARVSVRSSETDVWVSEYQNVSGVAVFTGKRLFSDKKLLDNLLTTGDLKNKRALVPLGQVFAGATFITENNILSGFAIPAGSTGASSYVTAFIQPSPELVAALVGSTVRFSVRADVTPNFLNDKPLRGAIQVVRNGATTETGTLVRSDQVGTSLYREALYTVTASDTKFGLLLQLLSNSTAATVAHSLTIRSVNLSIETWRGLQPNTGADALLDERLNTLKTDVIEDTKARLQVSSVTSDDMFKYMATGGQALNGATYRLDSRGNIIGFNIPGGQSGKSTYVTAFVPVEPDIITQLTGSTIRMVLIATINTTFAKKALSALAAQVKRGAAIVNAGQVVRSEVIGNKLYREVLYTVTATDTAFGVVTQIANSDQVESDVSTFEIAATSFRVEIFANNSLTTGADPLINLRLGLLKDDISTDTDLKISRVAITSGEQYSNIAPSYLTVNGAQPIRNTNGVVVGFTIPAGQSGKTSYVTTMIPIAADVASQLAGATIRIMVIATVSVDFLKKKSFTGIVAQAKRGGASFNVGTLVRNEQIGTTLYREVSYQVNAADTDFGVTLQIANSDSVADVVCSYEVTSTAYRVDLLPSSSLATPTDVMLDSRLQGAIDNSTGVPTVTKVTAMADGTGNYTSVKLAMAGITDATSRKPYQIVAGPTPFTDINWSTKDFVSISGIDRNRSEIRGSLPNDATASEITNGEPFRFNTTGTLQSIKITARNLRYAVHSDSSGSVKNGTQRIIDCHLEHYGNDDAVNNTWVSQNAWGCGTSSGQAIYAEGSTFIAPYAAFSFHTREYFANPCYVSINNCRLISSKSSGYSLIIQPLGSLQPCRCEVTKSQLVGDIYYSANPWIPTRLSDQPASHAEVSLTGAGNTSAVFQIVDFGRALKIESTDTSANSSISLSGSAVPVIFGQVFALPGSGGIKGYSYGWADVSGYGVGINRDVFITSLGKRLGDCSVANKVLSISVNGGAAVTVTFNKDYTALSNAIILAEINAVLGSSATASLYAIGERFRPAFVDEERSLRNESLEGILMGMACAYDGDSRKVRKMTAADPAALFAGIAWEDIYPGGLGRVKTSGHLSINDVLRLDSTALAFGDVLSVSTTPGYVVKGGSQGILTAIKSNAVRVGNLKS
jgi:hypothetical protein